MRLRIFPALALALCLPALGAGAMGRRAEPAWKKSPLALELEENGLRCQMAGAVRVRVFLSASSGFRFRAGSARLDARGEKVLARLAGVLAQYPARDLRVYGFTESGGELAAFRAEAVRRKLVDLGIARGRFVEVSAGEAGGGRDGAQGRRVEVLID